MFVAGCQTSSEVPVAVKPKLPPLPAYLESECVDPGVKPINTVSDATGVIGETRVYAACNKKKHRDTKGFYRRVQSGFGG